MTLCFLLLRVRRRGWSGRGFQSRRLDQAAPRFLLPRLLARPWECPLHPGRSLPVPEDAPRAAPETSVCAELGVYRWPLKGAEDVNGSGFSRLPGSLSGPRSSGPGGCTFARSLSPPGIRSLALPPSLPSPAHPLAPLTRPPHLPSLGRMAPARLSSLPSMALLPRRTGRPQWWPGCRHCAQLLGGGTQTRPAIGRGETARCGPRSTFLC